MVRTGPASTPRTRARMNLSQYRQHRRVEVNQMIIVQLPYPPSTNRMWRNNRGRMVLSVGGGPQGKGWLARESRRREGRRT